MRLHSKIMHHFVSGIDSTLVLLRPDQRATDSDYAATRQCAPLPAASIRLWYCLVVKKNDGGKSSCICLLGTSCNVRQAPGLGGGSHRKCSCGRMIGGDHRRV